MSPAPQTGVTTFATPDDRGVVFTRVVNAPRRMVFDAWTQPKHVRQWMLGPEGWTMPVCEMDLRVGGAWHYVWRKSDGAEMGMSGTYREIVPPERLVCTENWGPEWPETLNTVVLTELAGRTTITLTITYPTKEARDAALATGMATGMEPSFARLDNVVAQIDAGSDR